MKNDLQKQIPPYEGNEPYVYLAFAEEDKNAVRKLLIPLVSRGCRIWYCTGAAGSAEVLLHRQKRASGAALTLLYMTDAACTDTDTKSYVLVNQRFDRPILCLDPDGKDRRLTMGLRETVPHVTLYKCKTIEEQELAIIHGEGFSQQLLGPSIVIKKQGILRLLSTVLCMMALLMALVSAAFISLKPTQKDTVVFQDPAIYAAVKETVGGVALTEELLGQITCLELNTSPENWEDLVQLPALERIIIPQNAVLEGCPLPEGKYIIELSGGGA